jgi:hypothetical protein
VEPADPAIDLDVIDHAPGPPRPGRRAVIVAVLVGCAMLGYALSHRPEPLGATLARPLPRPHLDPVPVTLVESAKGLLAGAGGEAGGGIGIRTSNGPTAVSAQGATPGTYQVSLVCVGTGTVTVALSDGPPDDAPPSIRLACTATAGPAVTVHVTLRQPAFALLATPSADTVAAVGWSVRRV